MDKADMFFLSVILGSISSLYNEYGVLMIFVFVSVIIDIITGLLKAKINETVNSNAGFIGFWRKISLFVGLTFGFFLDILEQYLIEKSMNWLSINISFTVPFGMIIGVYIILNESISICENLYECGVTLPKFLVKSLKIAKKNIDNIDAQKKK